MQGDRWVVEAMRWGQAERGGCEGVGACACVCVLGGG
jgi:hypothetical protein